MKTTFIPVSYDSFDLNEKHYSLVFGRNEDGKRICLIDECPIYLWAILEEGLTKRRIEEIIKKIEKIRIEKQNRKTGITKIEIHNKKFLEKEVKALKIYTLNYKDLHDIASKLDIEGISKRRGYDLGFTTHYIIEKKLFPLRWYNVEGEMINESQEFGGIDNALDVDFVIKLENFKESSERKFSPKTVAYDIETDEIQIGKGEILMISLVSENSKKVITWKKHKTNKKYVEFVKNEKKLLERFGEYLKELSPDILVGYFSDGFDMPYIKSRADKLKVKLSLGVDGSPPKVSRGVSTSSRIKGITHIDLLKFIRTTYAQYMKSETLSLNEVSKEFLGDTKKKFEIKHSSKLDESNWEKYYEYNLHDSVLTLNLFKKFWADIMEFSRIIKEPIFEITRNGLSKQIESYILHNLDKFNEIPERRPGHDEIIRRRQMKKVQGAFVYEPTPGIYEKLAMFDFTSMHTSIIISYNLSKGTYKEKRDKNCYKSPEIEVNGEKINFYFSKKKGFFPSLMEEIFNKRKQFKEEYKKNPSVITKARSNAFKLLSASAHGYVGFFGARYYSWEASSTILSLVRKLNKEIIKKIEEKGYKVIYGDTDSVAFTIGNTSKKEIKNLLEKLNQELPGVMELELEGFFERGLWVTTRSGETGAKKKYAMITEKGDVKIRGFETVRRDWCPITRKMQDKIIRLILNEGNEKSALRYLKNLIKKIKDRDIERKELLIKTQLKKPISEYKSISPHVIAARKMKELNIPVSQGSLIEYYIAETKNKTKLVRDKVKLPSEKGKYDIEYYLNKQILPAVENIFQVFGINIKNITEGKRQMTLGEF